MISVEDVDNLTKSLLTNEDLDSRLQVCKTFGLLKVLLNIKYYRVINKVSEKIYFDVISICDNENEDVELVCALVKISLLISKDPHAELAGVVKYVLGKIQLRDQDEQYILRMLKILKVILIFTRSNNVDDETIKHINRLLLMKLKNSGEVVKVFVNSHIIPNYIVLMSVEHILDFMNSIFLLCKDSNNLNILCNVYNFVDAKILGHSSSLIHYDIYYEFLSESISSDKRYLQKQAIYLLTKSIHVIHEDLPKIASHKYVTVSGDEKPLKVWNIFFTLIDISREKQLHLIQPSLKLLNYVRNLNFIWQMSVFKLLLKHSQVSVVYETAIKITQIVSNDNFNSIIVDLLMAVNKNEYSLYSTNMFEEVCKKLVHLNKQQIIMFLEVFLNISWNPTALWSLLCSMSKYELFYKIPVDFYDPILSLIQKLPHIYIRDGCRQMFLESIINNVGKCYIIEDFLKVCNIMLFYCQNQLYFEQFSQKHYREEYLENILQGVSIDEINDAKFICCLILVKKFNLQPCIGYLIENIDKYETSCQISIFEHFHEYFTRDLYLHKKITEYFDIKDFAKVDSFLSILTKLDYYFPLQSKCEKVLLEPDLYDTTHIYLAFKILQCEEVKILKLWESKFFNPAEKIDSQICLGFVDLYFSPENINKENVCVYLNLIEHIFDSQTDNVVIKLFEKLDTLISLEEDDDEYIIQLLNLYYSQFERLKRNKGFKLAVKNYITALFVVAHRNEYICCKIVEKSNLLLEMAQTFDVIYYYFAQSMCDNFFMLKPELYVHFVPLIVDIILQGTIVQKEFRIEYNICQEILNTFKDPNSSPYLQKLQARVTALKIVYRMAKEFDQADIFVSHLLQKHEQYFNKRYFPDSQIHLQKLRILQTLLLLAPHVKTEKNNVINLIIESFCVEIHQPCIRQLMQWLLILLIEGKEETYIKKIRENIDATTKTQPSTIAAFIPVLLHVGLRNPEAYLQPVMQILLSYCMGANFKLRVYSQMAIKVLYEQAMAKGYTAIVDKYDFLKSSIDEVISASDKPFFDTLGSDKYFYDRLDAQKHYSVKAIFVDIPKLNHVTHTEWENLLNPINEEFLTTIKGLELLPGDEMLKQKIVEDTSREIEIGCNIQTKITPWKDAMQEKTSSGDFILIASLIDKPTNLGGLSRTCEVFGAGKLVLNDAKISHDKQFKSLSMSSESWVNILEVKVESLRDFIVDLKGQGYTVFGAEQTAESVMLNEYKFSKKTALLLGNEKEGIPANLIPILDVCVEIPQFGMIRSLNVHVAGATFIWEYTKQHLA